MTCKLSVVLFVAMITLATLSLSVRAAGFFPTNKWSRQMLASKQRLGRSQLECTPRVYRACWSIRRTCRHRRRDVLNDDGYMRNTRRRYVTYRRSKRYTLTELLTVRPQVNCQMCRYLRC